MNAKFAAFLAEGTSKRESRVTGSLPPTCWVGMRRKFSPEMTPGTGAVTSPQLGSR